MLIARMALDTVLEAGQQTLPLETGGVLLGFRIPGSVVITRALVVPDPRSSHHSYVRRRHRAQHLMSTASADFLPVVGYVGEWHTHPADAPPSRTDRRALVATARLATGPVALLVPAYSQTGPAHLHGLIAHVLSWPVPAISPVDLEWAEVQPVEDAPDSLEAEAATLLPPLEGSQ